MLHAAGQERPNVADAGIAWRYGKSSLKPGRLIFLDETSVKTNMARTHGRARLGERLVAAVPHGHRRTSSSSAASARTATRAIGRMVGCTTGTASKWRARYARDRLAGLEETGERGAAAEYGPGDQKRILAMLDQPPPEGYANWTAPLLARALGDVHEQYIWRFLRAQKIDLSGRKSWCESNDPEFAAKAAEIVGLYMAPPAVVLSVDEKPSIQAQADRLAVKRANRAQYVGGRSALIQHRDRPGAKFSPAAP